MQITLNANELDLAIKDYVRDRVHCPEEYTFGKVQFYSSPDSPPTPGPIRIVVELEPKP